MIYSLLVTIILWRQEVCGIIVEIKWLDVNKNNEAGNNRVNNKTGISKSF